MDPLKILNILFLMTGVSVLVYALKPTRQIIISLSEGKVSKHWKLLQKLILFFIGSYCVFLLYVISTINDAVMMFISVVFMSGAGFVLLVCNLSLSTVQDIKRISILEKENLTDPLTGLFNRRHFDDCCNSEFERSKRYNLPLSLLIVDVDFFKKINDEHGHAAGDDALIRIGQLINQSTRCIDIVARYGGEEFVVVQPNTALPGSQISAEHVRKLIEETPITINTGTADENELTCTVSIGVASLQENTHTTAELFRQADEALYRAKGNGRNRVETYIGQDGAEAVKSTAPVLPKVAVNR